MYRQRLFISSFYLGGLQTFLFSRGTRGSEVHQRLLVSCCCCSCCCCCCSCCCCCCCCCLIVVACFASHSGVRTAAQKAAWRLQKQLSLQTQSSSRRFILTVSITLAAAAATAAAAGLVAAVESLKRQQFRSLILCIHSSC